MEASVLTPPLRLLVDVMGRPAELRFCNLEVGAELACCSGLGVVGGSCRVKVLFIDAREGILLFFDVGLGAIECWGWPKARPTAATPTVPDAQSY